MYLIHWPGVQKLKREDPMNAELRAKSWKAMEELKQSGEFNIYYLFCYQYICVSKVAAYSCRPDCAALHHLL
jgi:hypothetical protein